MNTKWAIAVLLLLAAVVLSAGVIYYAPADASVPANGLPAPRIDGGSPATATADGETDSSVRGQERGATKRPAVAPDQAAAKASDEFKSARAREDYLNSVFRPLAAQGVDVALARVRELPDAEARDMAMLALLGEWSGLTVTELARRGDVGRFGVAGALALELLGDGKISPQQTAAMANEYLSGDERVGVLARAAEKLAATDPTAALAMGDGLADWSQSRFLSHFVSGWASTDPGAAREWASKVSDPRTRSALVGRVLAEQVKTDPAAAAQTFALAPPEDGRVRQRTARQIAAEWAGKDTVAAMQWAGSLSDQNDREAASQGVRSAAPVGIGARLSSDSDGVPVLDALVPGGPASTSGQLRSGDRVLAVADGSGSWVSSQNKPLGDVVRLIQGEANTRVSLQVQSADGSAPRVITLGREQIIFRPGN